MPNQYFIFTLPIKVNSIHNLLIKRCSYIIVIILSSFKCMDISSTDPVSFTINENCPKFTIIGDMSVYRNIKVLSSGDKKVFSLESLDNENLKDLFIIDNTLGIIKVNQNIDREIICPQLSSTSGICGVTLLVRIINDIINIIIVIEDENDNTPVFDESHIINNIKESSPIGTIIFLKHATDLDSSDNGIGEYRLTSEKVINPFVLKYNFSVIYLEVVQNLDYEQYHAYYLTLSVCDKGIPKRCSSQSLSINVLDVNDNYPIFKKQKYFAIINEDHPIGKIVLQVTATDLDSKKYGLIKYQFAGTNNEAKELFQLDSKSGELYLIRPLSNLYKNIQFVIEAHDNGPIPNINCTLVVIHINDINNHFPDIKITESTFSTKIIKISPNKSLVSFYENNPANTDIVFIVVTDKDIDENGQVRCSMKQLSSNWLKMLKFNSIPSKVIYRLMALESANCEDQEEIKVIINCSDSAKHPKYTVHNLIIRILDLNEFHAVFNKTSYSVSVKENTNILSIFMPIYDRDCSSEFSILIRDDFAKSHFQYIQATQRLVLKAYLDYEERSFVNFSIEIINEGAHNIILTSTTFISVIVIDINDNYPIFTEPRSFQIAEDALPGSVVGYLKANDSDEDQNAVLQFKKLNLSQNDVNQKEFETFLVGSDGIIKLAITLDREKQHLYLLIIIVSDMGTPSLSTTGTITISITDVNDNNPLWIFPNKNDNTINESIYTQVGIIITRLHAIDIDGSKNNNISYHIISDNAKEFYLHPIKGELSFVIPPKQGTVVLDIIASDNGMPQRSNQTKLIIFVSDKIMNSNMKSSDSFTFYGYFPLVAVIPTMILISIIMLILCLLLIIRRRNSRHTNARNPLNDKMIENLSPKSNQPSNSNDKALQNKMLDSQTNENCDKFHKIDALDLTQAKPLPKISYQCLVKNDLDVCSADSGEGASEDDISNYFMLKPNEQYRIGGCSQHCCSLLPENTMGHFICSTINRPILYSHTIESFKDSKPNSYLLYNTKYGSMLNKSPKSFKMSGLKLKNTKQ